MEPGGVDEHVRRVLDAVRCSHAVGRDALDRLRDQLHVVALEGAIPGAVVDQEALATRRVFRD